jgi:alkyldihydroxyacetonephosphate synthase
MTQPGVDWGRFRLAALDMDGTLAAGDGRVNARTIDALHHVERAGIRVVIVTGRAHPTALDVWRAAGLSGPLITCGGALTLQPPALEVLAVHPLPPGVVGEALRLGRRLGLAVSIWTHDRIWVTEPGAIADLLGRINEIAVDTLPVGLAGELEDGSDQALKVMLGGDPAVMDRLEPQLLGALDGAALVRSMPEFVEATAPGAGKEPALRLVMERLGIAPDQLIAAGDSDNDVAMLKLAGLAVVPADAMAAARECADLVVGPHDEDGLAGFLETLTARRSAAAPMVVGSASGGSGPASPAARIAGLTHLLGPHAVSTEGSDLELHSYDAWPVAVKWHQQGKEPHRPAAVVRPATVELVSRLMRWATESGVPITPWGLGSSVTGASLPLRGGVALDLTSMSRVTLLDEANLLVRVQAGKLGLELENELQARGYTLGHSPQSLDRSTVGGWVATRGTGQFSSRYGSIEDLVVALSAVLPTGELVETPMVPRAAMGPDLRHLFLGAEGTTGVVVEVTLKIFPLPELRLLEALRFETVDAGVAAMRLITRVGLRPFLVRFYDRAEAPYAMGDPHPAGDGCVMFLGVEGVAAVASAEMAAALDVCTRQGGERLGAAPVEAWMARRFDFSGVEKVLQTPGGVAETIEISHFWDQILDTYAAMKLALAPLATEVLGHFSHVYPQGTSLYLILLGQAADDAAAEERLQRIWDVAMRTALEQGAAVSHHHGIGLARLPYLAEALGSALPVLQRVTATLDPGGVMNPGKLAHQGARRSIPAAVREEK